MTQHAKILSFDEAKQQRKAAPRHAAGSSARVSSHSGSRAHVGSFNEADERRASMRLAEEIEEDAASARRSGHIEESRLSAFKRKLAKGKAGRAFTRQYGGKDSAASQTGPRAAVYKGEMGSSHRRAARMQNGEGARSRSGRAVQFATKREKLFSHPKLVGVGAVFCCLLLTGAFLYPSAQQLYHTVRERDQLQAEYAAIEQRNDSIQSLVSSLSTNEGVKDRARQEFGWVEPGEHAVNVYGLDVKQESTFTASVVSGSVAAPETWYSKLLDPIFGAE